jgi:integrase
MPPRKIDGSWHCDFWFDRCRYRKKAPLNTRGAADELERMYLQRLMSGHSIEPPKIVQEPTFGQFAKRWYETYVMTNNKPSEQFQKQSILTHHLLPYFSSKPLSKIDGGHIEGYKSLKKAKGLSDKTINNHLGVLSKCLHSANEWGELKALPRIKGLKTISQRLDHLSPEESTRLLSDTQEPLRYGLILIALHTGMRPGEIAALTWENVDLDLRIITVRQSIWKDQVVSTKTHRERHIPMSDDVCAYLNNRTERTGFVFARPDGRPTGDLCGKVIRRICKRVGLRRICWYTLRHTFASQLVSKGVPLPAVQALMGHANIGMTMRYAHMAPSVLKDAVDLLGTPKTQHASMAWPMIEKIETDGGTKVTEFEKVK